MKKYILYLLIATGLSLAAAGQDKTDSIALNKKKKVAAIQYGTASYYANKFEGRNTATGEVFTQKGMTAASNTFPLNCWVRVTNISNKKSVIVRINDRMHRLNKRLIDMSRTAAVKLGYISKGLTKVKVEYLGKRKPGKALKEEGL